MCSAIGWWRAGSGYSNTWKPRCSILECERGGHEGTYVKLLPPRLGDGIYIVPICADHHKALRKKKMDVIQLKLSSRPTLCPCSGDIDEVELKMLESKMKLLTIPDPVIATAATAATSTTTAPTSASTSPPPSSTTVPTAAPTTLHRLLSFFRHSRQFPRRGEVVVDRRRSTNNQLLLLD